MAMLVTLITQTTKWEVVKICASVVCACKPEKKSEKVLLAEPIPRLEDREEK